MILFMNSHIRVLEIMQNFYISDYKSLNNCIILYYIINPVLFVQIGYGKVGMT